MSRGGCVILYNMKNKFGFTVIEILVVIGIIAILTVIIFPSIDNIRKKNRDTERVADIGAIQLGLSLYKSQYTQNVYPVYIYDGDGANPDFSPKYVTADSLLGPDGEPYEYVPLAKNSSPTKCTSYHLGVTLESGSGQIDTNDTFSTAGLTSGAPNAEGYVYCTATPSYSGPGIPAYSKDNLIYAVHP